MISRSIQEVPDQLTELQVFLRKVLRDHYQDLRDLYQGDAEIVGSYIATTRVVSTDSPYTILASDSELFIDTDGGAVTVNLLAGINGKQLRIINTGSSLNDITIAPDDTELLTGTNASRTLSDGGVIILTYETTEGWW